MSVLNESSSCVISSHSRRTRSGFSPLAMRSTIFFGISGAPAAISLRARATSRALPISSSASAALAASASYCLRGRMAISPLSVFLKRTFMALVLSVVDFSAVADRNDDDRGAFLNEHHTPIADPKAATTAALEPLHIARSVRSVGGQLGVDPSANVSGQFYPLPGRGGGKGNLLDVELSHIAIIRVNQKYRKNR